MSRPSEVLSELVSDLRLRRSEGASVSQLVTYLQKLGLELSQINEHFRVAFCLSGRANLMMMPQKDSGELIPEVLDTYIGAKIDETLKQWINAPDYPDLMRRRDRHTFKVVARMTGNVFVVCAANRFAGQYIGKPGYKPLPVHSYGIARTTPPNQGLVAADPNEPKLEKLLKSLKPSKTYSQYKEYLTQLGFKVGNEEDGYILRDQSGSAFYPGYYLHGVYHEENGMNAWTGDQGEKIRAELNRRMGAELVQFGPHDVWDQRLNLEPANPLRGPQLPVLFFLPDGYVEVRFDAASMERYYRYLGIDWDTLYPSEAS